MQKPYYEYLNFYNVDCRTHASFYDSSQRPWKMVPVNYDESASQSKIIKHATMTVHLFIKWFMWTWQQYSLPWANHDEVLKWTHFLRCWPFVQGSHRSPVNSRHKGQWRGALMISLICAWINPWVNNRKAGDLRCLRAHYDVTVMCLMNNLVATQTYHGRVHCFTNGF